MEDRVRVRVRVRVYPSVKWKIGCELGCVNWVADELAVHAWMIEEYEQDRWEVIGFLKGMKDSAPSRCME